MLCRNCNKCKGVRVGYVSHRYWCSLTGDGFNGKAMGVYPWLDKPHPKCPLNKPGCDSTQVKPKVNQIKKKEVRSMNIKDYYLNELDQMFSNKSFQEMKEFLGSGICDSPCPKFKDDCPNGCSLFAALQKLSKDYTNGSLDDLKTQVCLYLNAIEKNKNKEEK